VLRVESLFGGPEAKSSVDRILDNLQFDREVVAFSDRTVSPSYVDDVVQATSALIDAVAPSGVYHCVNSGWTTWSGLARELAAIVGKPGAAIRDLPMDQARLLAPRPKFAALSNEKLTARGVEMPTWQSALRRYVESRASASADSSTII
jgi:dTDP-4-dehydrorhamnose reductase